MSPQRLTQHPDMTSRKGLSLNDEQMMVFRVGTLWLAVPASSVVALHSTQPPTPVPLAPEHIPGIASLRGEVVPLLNLAKFFGLHDKEGNSTVRTQRFERVAVITASGMRVGILCHEVRGVITINGDLLRPLQAARGRRIEALALNEFTYDKEVVVVLNVPTLLEEARVKT